MTGDCTYDEFLAAAARIERNEDLYWADVKPPIEVYQAYLERNAEALAAGRKALAGNCYVPVEYRREWFSSRPDSLMAINWFSWAISVETRVAILCHDLARVVHLGLELLRMANSLRRGGLILQMTESGMPEQRGLRYLLGNRRQFSSARRVFLLQELPSVESEREPVAQIEARDAHWMEVTGFVDNSPPEDATTPGWWEDQDNEKVSLLRMLLVDQAVREFRASYGSYPQSLAELREKSPYELPLDPYTRSEFRYRRHEDEFLLYSPGRTRIDHGGVPGHMFFVQFGRADLTPDVFECQEPDGPTMTAVLKECGYAVDDDSAAGS